MTQQPVYKPLATRYKGCYFRSRIEARWAVFFDHLGLPWEYEKQGYELGAAGPYLPDFWLPSLELWVEVKGEQPTDTSKQEALAELSGYDVVLVWGGIPEKPWYRTYEWMQPLELDEGGCSRFFACEGGSEDTEYQWCECPICGRIGVAYQGRSFRMCRNHDPAIGRGPFDGWGKEGRGFESKRIQAALTAGRSARFEFGETGVVLS